MKVNVNIWNAPSPHKKKSLRVSSLNSERRNSQRELSFEGDTLQSSSRCSCFSKTINLSKKVSFESNKCHENASEHSYKEKHYSVKTEGTEEKTQSFSELDKLLQITWRCIQCYNKFIDEKDSQLKIVKSAFSEIQESLNVAFNSIIMQIKKKQNQIENFLQKKQRQLKKIKDTQQTELNTHLQEIKSMHLVNLLGDSKHGDQSLKVQLSNYADTLHKFYEIIEKVEKYNFKEVVDETINLINNVIEEQMKLIIEGKLRNSSLNGSFSFSDKLGVMLDTVTSNFIDSASFADSFEQSLQRFIRKGHNKQSTEAWTQTLNSNLPQKNAANSQVLREVNKRQHLMKSKIDIYQKFNL